MRLYFDCCCYNSPFDDQAQDRIHDESEAILSIMKRCRTNKEYIVLGSTVLNTIMHVSVHMKSAVNGSLFAY